MKQIIFVGICWIMIQGCTTTSSDPSVIFHYNQPNNITSLDPAFARNMTNIWAVHHLYSKLVRLDSNMNVVSDLAKSWEMDSTGTQYTFHLHSNVQFHHDTSVWDDEAPFVTAEDVAYSLTRLNDPDVGSPGSWLLEGRLDSLRPMEVIDDSTFCLYLRAPFSPILSILTMEYCGIVHQDAVEYYGEEYRSNPVGTGPFQFRIWRENQGLFLERHQGYGVWNSERPHVDGIRVSFIRDRKTALLELLTGNLDFISGYDISYQAILLDEKRRLKQRHSDVVRLNKASFLNTEYLGINLEKARDINSPLANKYFRKALNFALDKALLVDALNGGIGKPGNSGFIPAGLPAYSEQQVGYPFNLDSANYYLSRSEYDGREIVLQTNKDYLEKCLFSARMWEQIGVRCKVELLESSMLRDLMRKGESVFFRASWIGDYPNAENFLSVFYGQNSAPPNYTRFSNDRFDRLYEEGLSQGSPDIMRSANQVLIDEAPVIFLYYDESFILTNKRVGGLQFNALNLLETEWIEKNRSL